MDRMNGILHSKQEKTGTAVARFGQNAQLCCFLTVLFSGFPTAIKMKILRFA